MTLHRVPARGKPVFLQTFDAGTTGFALGGNASALTRDTTKDAGYPSAGSAALRWTATATGDTVLSGSLIQVTPGTDILATVKLWVSGTGTYSARTALDWYDLTGSTYQNGEYGFTRGSLPQGRWVTLICPVSLTTNSGYVQPSVTVFAAAAGQQQWVDNYQITA